MFGCDSEVKNLIETINERLIRLDIINEELKEPVGLSEEERKKHIRKRGEIKIWFRTTRDSMEVRFEKYLRLEH